MNLKTLLPAIVVVAMLGGLWLERRSYPTPEEAAEYHQLVEAAVSTCPYRIGPWEGRDVSIPQAAIALLRPNAILSRVYFNKDSRQSVSFLIVQCRTARDMVGHYPPICYPANGWKQQAAQPMDVTVGGEQFKAMSYEFYRAFATRSTTMYVANAMFLPDGQTARSMKVVSDLAADYRKHFFGAAQVQMTFSGDVSADDRKAILETFLGANLQMLQLIRSGVEI
jgi:hypothetical protein